jgi:iron complex outermembrane receptor protein
MSTKMKNTRSLFMQSRSDVILPKKLPLAVFIILAGVIGEIPFALAGEAGASSKGKVYLEEITVRAQRIEESLQDVPVAVQPVTGEDLERAHLNDLTQLTLVTPSFQAQNEGGFTIRGVGSSSFASTVDSSVGVAVDEVSLGVPLFMSNGLFDDVEQVEVLMGPQGLLFGRNASAGLLNVVTRSPVFNDVEGRILLGVDYRDTLPGNNSGESIKGMLNVPVGDMAAFRINGYYNDQDSLTNFVANSGNNRIDDYQRRYGFRAKLLAEPSDQLRLYLIGDYSEERGFGGIFERTARFFAPGSLTEIFSGLDGVDASPNNFDAGVSTDFYRDVDTGGASLNVSYELSPAITVSNILAWRAYNFDFNIEQDGTSFDGLDVNNPNSSYKQLSNELRFAFNSDEFIDGQFGLYYFESRQKTTDRIGSALFGIQDPVPGFFDSETNPLIGLDSNNRFESKSYAAFGQFNVHPASGVTLLVGGRLTHDKVDLQLVETNTLFNYPVSLVPTINSPGLSSDTQNTDFSWKLGAEYQIAEEAMGYVTLARGYKGPTINTPRGVPGEQLAVGPETVHSLEVGLKSTWFDRKMRVNLAAFLQKFDDFQVQSFDPSSQTFFLGNAAEVKSQGIEILIDARPIEGLSLSLGATLLDSRFDNFQNDSCYAGQTVDMGCVVIASVDGNQVFGSDSTGNHMPTSAKFTSTMSAQYQFPLSSSIELYAGGSYYYRSKMFFSTQNDDTRSVDSIGILGLNTGMEFDNRLRFEIFCKNCTDKKFPLGIGNDAIDGTILNLESSVQLWGYNSVRTIGATLSYNF